MKITNTLIEENETIVGLLLEQEEQMNQAVLELVNSPKGKESQDGVIYFVSDEDSNHTQHFEEPFNTLEQAYHYLLRVFKESQEQHLERMFYLTISDDKFDDGISRTLMHKATREWLAKN